MGEGTDTQKKRKSIAHDKVECARAKGARHKLCAMCARRGAQRGGEKVPTLGRVADSKEGLFKIGGVVHLKIRVMEGWGTPCGVTCSWVEGW